MSSPPLTLMSYAPGRQRPGPASQRASGHDPVPEVGLAERPRPPQTVAVTSEANSLHLPRTRSPPSTWPELPPKSPLEVTATGVVWADKPAAFPTHDRPAQQRATRGRAA